MKKPAYIICDTETGGSIGAPEIYDLAYVILDSSGNPIKQFNRIIKQNYLSIKAGKLSAYYKSKFSLFYDPLVRQKPDILKPWNYVAACFNGDLNDLIKKGYDPVFCAYNASFDIRALEHTAKKLGGTPIDLDRCEILDLLPLAVANICDSDHYRESAPLTASGKYYSATAEAVYQYVTEDPHFMEAHTALDDCLIEAEILSRILWNHPLRQNYGDFKVKRAVLKV